jgi:hypothetical protein
MVGHNLPGVMLPIESAAYGIHDYDAENISDDFVFEYDADDDELISAVYRRFNDGGIAF